MLFYILFIFIWIAIITLAKDKIKQKIKQFLNPSLNEYTSDYHILDDIKHEFKNFKKTLDMNVLTIRDELSNFVYKKIKHKNKKISKDIVEYKNVDEHVDMFKVFKKTIKILKKFIYDLFDFMRSKF